MNIATISLKLSVDYYPTTNATYDYYIGKYEVSVSPGKKWYFKSFDMCLMQSEEYYMDQYKIQTNHQDTLISQNFSFETGIYGAIGSDNVEIGGNMKIGMGYTISSPKDKVNVAKKAVYYKEGYEYNPYTVTHTTISSTKGATYNGLIYATYRVLKNQEQCSLGLTFKNLVIRGQIAEPSYDLDNADCCTILAFWSKPFNDKSMVILQGLEAGCSDKATQYFGEINTSSSLPNKHNTGFLIIRRTKIC